MAFDPFKNFQDSLIAPAGTCFDIVPSDVAELPMLTKGIYIGEDGDVVLQSAEGDADVTFRNLVAGTILDIRVKLVRSTGTTAASLVGLA